MKTHRVRFAPIITACIFLAALNSAEAQVIKVLSGNWSGMARFKAHVSDQGRLIEDPTSIVRTEIYFSMDKQGNISGKTISNGCQINGLATPWMGDHNLQLQINFAGCSYIGFNRRFNGHLIYNKQRRTADLQLTAMDMAPFASRIASYQITGNVQL